MKAKCKKYYDDTVHTVDMMDSLMSMFTYKGLPDTLPDWLVETMHITEGTCGVCRMGDGNVYTGTGGYCGNVKNFLPEEYQITNIGITGGEGATKRGKIGEDFVVGWNNSTHTPDWMVMQTASILTEIDVSERCNVLFSRMLRIPKVADSKEKKAVEAGVKAIMEGRFEAVISDNVLSDLIDSDREKFLDLVDVQDVDKLQYLNQYRDNIVKRFYQYYGQGLQITSKLAQQTTDEIHGTDAVSMIHVLDRLKYRKKFCDDLNNLFGLSVSVELSPAWQDQLQEMQETHSDGTPDETPTEIDTEGGEDSEREAEE